MSQEKKFTAREAAVAVLKKTEEMLKAHQATLEKGKIKDALKKIPKAIIDGFGAAGSAAAGQKPEIQKYETENSAKPGVMPPHRHEDTEEGDDAYETVDGKKKGKKRIESQKDPKDNPKENAEGNNPAPGAEPFNVEKYGAEGQKPGAKMGKSEGAEHPHGGIVVSKHGEYFAQKATGGLHHIPNKEHGQSLHGKNVKFGVNENDEAVLHPDHDLKKDATSAIQGGINAATGGSSQSAPPPSAGVAASLGSAFGKAEGFNPEKSKGKAKLAKFLTHVSNKKVSKR